MITHDMNCLHLLLKRYCSFPLCGVLIWQLMPRPGFGQDQEMNSDPAHVDAKGGKPAAWPGGIIPFDLSSLNEDQAKEAKRGMQLWMETGANIKFVPRSNESAYVYFTGKTDAGNNTSFNGYRAGTRIDVNITAFWWRQGPWMPAHELGHVLGFHHEHQRWDRDRHVTIHYEHIKPGRESDYDWIPKTNWIVATDTYDYRSIMHYRTCWASRCEPECKDGDGASPCAVIDPIGTEFDKIIGQWTANQISKGDAEKARLAYGTANPK
jgi:hypothetical protein